MDAPAALVFSTRMTRIEWICTAPDLDKIDNFFLKKDP